MCIVHVQVVELLCVCWVNVCVGTCTYMYIHIRTYTLYIHTYHAFHLVQIIHNLQDVKMCYACWFCMKYYNTEISWDNLQNAINVKIMNWMNACYIISNFCFFFPSCFMLSIYLRSMYVCTYVHIYTCTYMYMCILIHNYVLYTCTCTCTK